MLRLHIFFALFLGIQSATLAQCDTGSEPECMCETAEVLCSVVDLDGFSGEMSTFSHAGDGPNPFCNGSFSDNPNWFGFIAWCENITFELDLSNCTGAGVQLALFTDCTFSEEVDCDDNCNSSTVTLDLDLIIGEDYFLLLDGCTGTACDYEVSVSPTNCDEFI